MLIPPLQGDGIAKGPEDLEAVKELREALEKHESLLNVAKEKIAKLKAEVRVSEYIIGIPCLNSTLPGKAN